MLLNKQITKKAIHSIALLVFISIFILNNSICSAGLKDGAAKQYRAKGYEEQQNGNYTEALTNYNKAISLGSEDAVILNDMGILYEYVNMPSQAEASYLQAIEYDRSYLPVYTNLAYLYLRGGYNNKAFKYFRLRYELSEPGDPWAEKAKDELLKIYPEYKEHIIVKESKEFEDEIVKGIQDEFKAKIKKSNQHYKNGKRLLKGGDYKQALKEFNMALKLTPNNPKILKARNQIFIEMAKDNIKEYSGQALKMLDSGDPISARNKIHKMLTTLP